MKITGIDVFHADPADIGPQFVWRAGLPGSDQVNTMGYLVIRTDEGISGVAPASRGSILADIVDRRLRPELLGADPLRREWLWHRIWEIDRIELMPLYTLGTVDVALWDIAAQAAGLPLHDLLGSFREAVPAYASTVTFASIEQYLSVADQSLALGYPAIKLHAWGDARRDAALVTALREHVGDDVPLMYDGSAGFDLADAVYLGRALDDNGYLWYEEPMREFNVTAHKWLSERVRTPLLVAETSPGANMNTADFIASGCATMVRTSWGLRGGITGALRTAHLAESFHLRAEVHGGGPISAALACAIPNNTYYEALVDTDPVRREDAVGEDGLVRPAGTAGIGYSPKVLDLCGLEPR